jgi:Putative DNA-binding domain
MKSIPIEELLYEEESTTLDFKREEYKFVGASDVEKSELLKDILSFANAWRRTDAYILIGVEEVKGNRSKVNGIKVDLDDAQLQQLVNSKTQRPVEFEYRTATVDGLKIGILRIPVQTRPSFLKKDFGKLKRHAVYIRRGTSTEEASPDEVRDMGRSEVQILEEAPSLSFEFADLESRSSLGTVIELSKTLLNVPAKQDIPDYEEPRNSLISNYAYVSFNQVNRDYYRELVNFHYFLNKTTKLTFSLKNDSSRAISDVNVELMLEKQEEKFLFFKGKKFPDLPKSRSDPLGLALNMPSFAQEIAKQKVKTIEIQDLGDKYRLVVSFEKIQPKQTIFNTQVIYLDSNDSFVTEAKVTIYADNILPIEQTLKISCKVEQEDGGLSQIIERHNNLFFSNKSAQ